MTLEKANTVIILTRHARTQKRFTQVEFLAITSTIVEALEIRLARIENKLAQLERSKRFH